MQYAEGNKWQHLKHFRRGRGDEEMVSVFLHAY